MATRARRGRPTAVFLEVGSKRVFACALDWPGWCRAGKDEELALAALAAYAPRYAVVPERAGIAYPARVGENLEVVERLPGSATTDFGAPGEIAGADAERTTRAQAERLTALVVASWAAYARKLGVKHRQPAIDDQAAIAALRDDIVAVLRASSDGSPPRPKGWPPRYAARRIAWHVLDHAWEIEDRSDPTG